MISYTLILERSFQPGRHHVKISYRKEDLPQILEIWQFLLPSHSKSLSLTRENVHTLNFILKVSIALYGNLTYTPQPMICNVFPVCSDFILSFANRTCVFLTYVKIFPRIWQKFIEANISLFDITLRLTLRRLHENEA